jgi:hypothetical protein
MESVFSARFAQRVIAAARAISLRRSGVITSKRFAAPIFPCAWKYARTLAGNFTMSTIMLSPIAQVKPILFTLQVV